MKGLHRAGDFLKAIVSEWRTDKAWLYAAALAFYVMLSLAPLLVVVLAVVGIFLGQTAAIDETVTQVRQLAGEQVARIVERVADELISRERSLTAAAFAGVFAIIGASNVFVQLKNTLNMIWGVQPQNQPKPLIGFITARAMAILFALAAGVLLLLSLLISSVLTAIAAYFSSVFPTGLWLWRSSDIVGSFLLLTLLFTSIYRFVPDARLRWRDAALGGAVTSVLFNVGKYLISLYLGWTSVASVYGAAGSVVVFLLWVYYSAEAVLLGAEFTSVYARRYGSLRSQKPS